MYKHGDYNAICDRCGFKVKASTLKKTWDGFMVCPEDWEPRHPLDFAKGPRPERVLPFTRPEGEDVSIGPTYISTSIGTQENTIPSGTFNTEDTI